MKTTYIPGRGDIVWINFNPTRGHEQAHKRPAIVLSPQRYNKKGGMMLACPITSKIKHYPFEVALEVEKQNSVILADHIRNMDWHTRKITFIQRAPSQIVNAVQRKILRLLTES
ncbi:MAG: endoribonuclease MazF [bacterium]|nr:endoribonuclease MazF [bacterium]MDZ4285782.1 endoribonuclease MazF [Candidatus Sungbacteria bacterium]